MRRAAASPFKGSVGLGYSSSCGRNVSKTFNKSASTGIVKVDGPTLIRRIIHAQVQEDFGALCFDAGQVSTRQHQYLIVKCLGLSIS